MPRIKSALTYLSIAFAASCTSDVEIQSDPERADELGPFTVAPDSDFEASPCDGTLIDKSGRQNPDGTPIQHVANRLGDAFAKAIYQNAEDGCPLSYPEIIAKLRAQTTAQDCQPLGNADGLHTTVVSETAQYEGLTQATYRSVTNRDCDGEGDIWFSLFGYHRGINASDELDVAGSGFPDGLEVMAMDPSQGTDGVFNYYKQVGPNMVYFGNSMDMVERGPGGPNLTDVRGCANCHTGGGLIMKELRSPWLHWEGDVETIGDETLVESRPELGSLQTGPELENLVSAENNQISATRHAHLRETGQLRNILKPLFCPVEINIRNNFDGRNIQGSLLFDQDLGQANLQLQSFDAEADDYDTLKAAMGLVVPGLNKADTVLAYTFFERSQADRQMVFNMTSSDSPTVDAAFVEDVLMVDFSRPVFSDDRCDLLAFTPPLTPSEINPEAVRAGFIQRLKNPPSALVAQAAKPAAKQLLAHLEARADGQPFAHEMTRRIWMKSCLDRNEADRLDIDGQNVSGLLADFLKIRSLQRKVAFGGDGVMDNASGSALRPHSVFEFEQTMATDNVQPSASAAPSDLLKIHPDARLDPQSCQLVPELPFFASPRADDSVVGWGDACEGDFGEVGVCINTDVEACPAGNDEFSLPGGKCEGGANIKCCLEMVLDGEDF